MNEPKESVEKKLSLKGLEILRNLEPTMLGETLGHQFAEQAPTKVKMDIRLATRIALHALRKGGPMAGLGKLASLASEYRQVGVQYYEDLDIVVVVRPDKPQSLQDNKEQQATLREDLRAWQYRTNSEYMTAPGKELFTLISSLDAVVATEGHEEARAAVSAAVEKFMLSKALTGGMRAFGSGYTALNVDAIQSKTLYLSQHRINTGKELTHGQYLANKASLFDYDVNTFLEKFEWFGEIKNELVEQIMQKEPTEELITKMDIAVQFADLGYMLVQGMIKARLPEDPPAQFVGKVLSEIMMNPPEKITDILGPRRAE